MSQKLNRACCRYVLVAIVLLVAAGCDSKEKSALEHFRETQTRTLTPHGRIKPESIQSAPGDKIQYETEGGEVFQVVAEKQGSGYRYRDAVRIK